MGEMSASRAVCSCEDTMPLDLAAIAKGAGSAELTSARHLCRTQIEQFKAMLGPRWAS